MSVNTNIVIWGIRPFQQTLFSFCVFLRFNILIFSANIYFPLFIYYYACKQRPHPGSSIPACMTGRSPWATLYPFFMFFILFGGVYANSQNHSIMCPHHPQSIIRPRHFAPSKVLPAPHRGGRVNGGLLGILANAGGIFINKRFQNIPCCRLLFLWKSD